MQISFLHLFEQQSSSSLQLPFIRLQVGLFVHCSLLYDRWQNPVQHPAKFLQPSPNFLHIPTIEYHLLYSALIFWSIKNGYLITSTKIFCMYTHLVLDLRVHAYMILFSRFGILHLLCKAWTFFPYKKCHKNTHNSHRWGMLSLLLSKMYISFCICAFYSDTLCYFFYKMSLQL